MLISNENNHKAKRNLVMAGLGLMVGTSLLGTTKAKADNVNAQSATTISMKNNSSDTTMTASQYNLYQSNQKRADDVKEAQVKAKALEEQKKKAQEEQNKKQDPVQVVNKQISQEEQQKAQDNVQQQADNSSQQNKDVNVSAKGDSAVNAFNQAKAQSLAYQEQANSEKNKAEIAKQAKEREEQRKQFMKETADKEAQLKAQKETQLKTQKENQLSVNSNNSSSTNQTPTGSGSVYDEFIKAGGTPDMWKYIVMPESSGNPNAVNGRYSGLFQTDKGNGTAGHSVTEQTKWALQYAQERYGGIEGAIAFRQSHNWW